MLSVLLDLLRNAGVSGSWLTILAYLLLSILVLILSIGTALLIQYVIIPLVFHMTKNSRLRIFGIIRKRRILERLTLLVPPFVFYLASDTYGKYTPLISRIIDIYLVLVLIILLHAIFNSIDDIYRSYEVSKKRPIKGFLQILELVIVIVFATVMVASWIGESPAVLLGGIGAFTALLSVIFKDTLLGFVAGIQLTSNDMVRIGDWIEMPKYAVDGTVTDITLISVKINNFDHTSTTVPAYALVTDSFKNWRDMTASGARRIKRAVYLDMTSITFCSEKMLDRFSVNPLLSDYIRTKKTEFASHNKKSSSLDRSNEHRRLTNIGVFRVYLEEYLRRNPFIHNEMTILVRQLPAENRGLPMEIYCFSRETDWILYENIQSDLFDHVYAIAPFFDLRLFQEPTGHDMRGQSDLLNV